MFPGPSALPVPLGDLGDRRQIPTPPPLALRLRTGWSSSVRSVSPLGGGNCSSSYCTEMLGGICITQRPSEVSVSHARHRPQQGQGREAGAGAGKMSAPTNPAALFVKKEYLRLLLTALATGHTTPSAWVPAWEARAMGRRPLLSHVLANPHHET